MKKIGLITIIAAGIGTSGCSSLKSALALDEKPKNLAPIHNPFPEYLSSGPQKSENMVLRTRKGDRSVEVEIPGGTSEMSDFVVPMSPAFKDGGRSPASSGDSFSENDTSFRDRKPSIADRELLQKLPTTLGDEEGRRREVETGLGVVPAEEESPDRDSSYLAALDHVKQLYRRARFEAALLEVDEMLRQYPTDGRLYQMRGTLFDRLGRVDLALKSWSQALRLEPQNQSLRKFVDRKQQKRGLASP